MAYDIVHVEIPMKDERKTTLFYENVFLWKIIKTEGFNDYLLFQSSEQKLEGAFYKTDLVADGSIILYIQTDDMEKTGRLIEKWGGQIVQPKKKISDEIGFYLLFKDPAGNQLGVFQNPIPIEKS